MSGRRGERSREDTWGEQELGKYIGKQKSGAAYGSPKSNPRARDKGPGSHSKDKDAGSHSRIKDTGSHSKDKDVGSRSKDKDTGSHVRSSQKSDKVAAHRSQLTEKHTPKSSPAAGRREARGGKEGRAGNVGQQRSSGSTADRPQQARGRGRERSDREKEEGTRERAKRGRESRGDAGRGRASRGGSDGQSKDQEPERLAEGRAREGAGAPRGGEGPAKQRGGDAELSSGSMGSFPRPQGLEPGAPIGDELLEQERKRKAAGAEKKVRHVPTGDGAGERERREEETLHNIAQAMVEVAGDHYEEEEEEEVYEEDFDEDTESSSEGGEQSSVAKQPVDLVEIMQAIDAENQFIRGHLEGQSALEGFGVVPSAPFLQQPSRTFIDFSQAQRREVVKKAARKTRKRGQELLSMIELDIVAFDLFTLAPQSEYEVYIKNFGSSGTQQAVTQTGEDCIEVETQSEEVETREKWVQWPPEDLRGYGGPMEDTSADEVEAMATLRGESSAHLLSFLKRASQVCSALLAEGLSAGQPSSQPCPSPLPLCSNALKITPSLPILTGRHPVCLQPSLLQSSLILASYSSPSPPIASPRGLVCVWDAREPNRPLHILECEGSLTCCCFSPQKASLVFAGNDDGSIVLWDLREPSSMHRALPDSDGLLLRAPTFSTAGISVLHNHTSPLVTIAPLLSDTTPTPSLPPPSLLTLEDAGSGSSGLSFQLATMDSNGGLSLWVVVEVAHPDPHGSESDLGLVPGGRVKLVRGASISLCGGADRRSLSASGHGLVRTHCLSFHPLDSNHLYIGTDAGDIVHRTRYGKRPIPSVFHADSPHCGAWHITSLSFSVSQPDYFLASCSNGSLHLHHARRASPLVSWFHSTAGVGIRHVQWLEHSPGVFLALDQQSTLHIWDLLRSDAEPVHREQFKTSITSCTLTPPPLPPALLLSLSNGSIEVHTFDSGLLSREPDRHQQLQTYFESLF